MPRTSDRSGRAKTKAAVGAAQLAQALERRVKRLEAQLAAARTQHERRLESVRRAANRRLAAMMQEIAALRHHEARAEALARVLAEREAALAAASSAGKRTSDGEDPRLPG